MKSCGRLVASVLLGLLVGPVPAGLSLPRLQPLVAQEQGPAPRVWTITASRYKFDPPRIEVNQDDLVKIELKTADIAHSFTIDAYRLAKRVSPAGAIVFEFRADQVGTFPFYCNLRTEDGCKQMHGELVVKPRR